MNTVLLLLKLAGVWVASYLLGDALSAIYWSATSEFGGGFEWFIEAAAWSFPIFVVALPLVYLPAMFGLRRLLGGVKPVAIFPMVAGILSIVPTTLMFLLYKGSGWLQVMFSPMNVAFHIMFFTAGVLFGLGFIAVSSQHAPNKGMHPTPLHRASHES